jgi:hypothetical protein
MLGLQMNGLTPSITATVFAVIGALALMKCFFERSLRDDRVWLIALLGVAIPSYALHIFGDLQSLRSHSIRDFILWESTVPLFWFVFLAGVIIFHVDTRKMQVRDRTKVPPNHLILRIGIVGILTTAIALAIFILGTDIMFGSKCAKIKCQSAEFLLGDRQTIHASLFFASILINLFFCLLAIRILFWLNGDRAVDT